MAIPDDRWAVSGEPVREYRPPEMEDSGGGETQVWTQIYINFIFFNCDWFTVIATYEINLLVIAKETGSNVNTFTNKIAFGHTWVNLEICAGSGSRSSHTKNHVGIRAGVPYNICGHVARAGSISHA